MDLLVRTSGESRLSDFLLLQSSTAYLHFAAALWPDFTFGDMLDALAAYQRAAPALANLRAVCKTADTARQDDMDRRRMVLSHMSRGSERSGCVCSRCIPDTFNDGFSADIRNLDVYMARTAVISVSC